MKIQEQYFTYSGTKISFFITGKGKPLLFLPGGLRVSTYLKNIEYLSLSYKVIALDLPGFGKSSTPHGLWSLKKYAFFLEKFLQKLAVGPLTVVGHSLGGGVGLHLAVRRKDIKKLIVINGMGLPTKHKPLLFYYHVLITKTINDFRAIPDNRMRAFIFNNALSTITENFSNTLKMLKITNKNMYQNISPKTLSSIEADVKILWGKYDELFPIENAHYLDRHIPRSSLQVVEGNHDWWTIYPERGYKMIKEFVG